MVYSSPSDLILIGSHNYPPPLRISGNSAREGRVNLRRAVVAYIARKSVRQEAQLSLTHRATLRVKVNLL